MATITNLALDAITADPRCQPRSTMSLELIGDYARAMVEGAEFPPLTVYRDGGTYYLADGFHRLAAAQDAGKKHVVCDVRPGDIRDAILHAAGANATHGQRRTNQDKRRAVETLLNDSEWVNWSNVQIAERCAVSEGLVRSLRPILVQNEDVPRLATRNGTIYAINTTNIGKAPPATLSIKTVPTEPTPPRLLNVSIGDMPADRMPPSSKWPAPDPATMFAGSSDDTEDEFDELPPSTAQQCESVRAAMEALFIALDRPDGARVEFAEVVQYVVDHYGDETRDDFLTQSLKLAGDIWSLAPAVHAARDAQRKAAS